MNWIEKTQLLERIDGLIRRKATGSARELADRLNISRNSVYRLLDLMEQMGADISYCCARKSYYYTSDKVLAIGYMDPDKIKGGKISQSPNFWDNRYLPLQYDRSREILRTL